MEYSDSFNIGSSFPVTNLTFERLNLELFSPHGRYLNVVIFVKHDGNVVILITTNFFPSILKQHFNFIGIKIEAIQQKLF